MAAVVTAGSMETQSLNVSSLEVRTATGEGFLQGTEPVGCSLICGGRGRQVRFLRNGTLVEQRQRKFPGDTGRPRLHVPAAPR
jgi:hypothetical protein